ncbi:hypothetical protein Anapl_17074 [Anas platyrhynchos]|uniref:Uncharacterized protein n=1 Tax=Anas platyrhynchos TaxID=8839 RepID=R0LWI7_ANAPL|nr:hypothetical protein Anapl_17074 [Anas platyrhynchos]
MATSINCEILFLQIMQKLSTENVKSSAENSRSDVQWCRPQWPSANRHTWSSSLTFQKASTYPRSLARTSETLPTGLRHEKGPAFTCHINQYRTKQKPTRENFKKHHRGQTVALHQLHYWMNALKEGFNDSQSNITRVTPEFQNYSTNGKSDVDRILLNSRPLGCGGRTGGSRHTDSRRGWAAVQNPAFLTGQSAGSVLPINGCEGSGDRLDDKAQNSSHKIQFLCIHPPLNRTHQWSATEHSRSSSVFIRGVCINQIQAQTCTQVQVHPCQKYVDFGRDLTVSNLTVNHTLLFSVIPSVLWSVPTASLTAASETL